ncbi:hypothetical protein CPS_4728 [Sporocytophaga myxococcoides]|uniref:Porin n=2 Tax=Sporocytophaga myxococcoides TaxID=153721 RepID=A0A098LMN2_9BACT|nr:hypothetical protein CPS_4728 [Sporocytophaga myxococcoides]
MYTHFYGAFAQDTDVKIDTLERRVKRLEVRFDTAAARLTSVLGIPNGLSRRNLEGGTYGSRLKLNTEKTVMEISGYIQGDFIHSFRQSGPYKDAMVPSTIPVPNSSVGETYFGIRQTRFTSKTTTKTEMGDLKTHFEFDLFAPNGATTFHIRHALGTLGRVSIGQYWTNFMDIDVFPNVFEYWGPNSMPFLRQPQIKYTAPLGRNATLAVSAESPGSQISIADSIRFSSRSLFPDGVINFRYTWHVSHIQLTGLLHPVSLKDNDKSKTLWGYGFNFSCYWEIFKRNAIVFEATYGKGIGKYFDDLGVQTLDAVVAPNGNYKLLPAYGGFLFYDWWWSDKFSSAIGYSYLHSNTFSSQPGTNYKNGAYGIANFTYYPVDYVKIGIEYQYGMREDIDNRKGENSRIQFSGNYKF